MIDDDILIVDEDKIENGGEDMIATMTQIYFCTFKSNSDSDLQRTTYNQVWDKHEYEKNIYYQEGLEEYKRYEQSEI